jgi:hypothetical protein
MESKKGAVLLPLLKSQDPPFFQDTPLFLMYDIVGERGFA